MKMPEIKLNKHQKMLKEALLRQHVAQGRSFFNLPSMTFFKRLAPLGLMALFVLGTVFAYDYSRPNAPLFTDSVSAQEAVGNAIEALQTMTEEEIAAIQNTTEMPVGEALQEAKNADDLTYLDSAYVQNDTLLLKDDYGEMELHWEGLSSLTIVQFTDDEGDLHLIGMDEEFAPVVLMEMTDTEITLDGEESMTTTFVELEEETPED